LACHCYAGSIRNQRESPLVMDFQHGSSYCHLGYENFFLQIYFFS
jgi:hypothetical protein